METIEEIVAGQDALSERVSQYIFESGGLPDPGRFPIEFTDTHDLEIDFLIREAIDYQTEDIANLVCFLASPLAGYISGAVIPVDGGLRRYQF